MKLDDMNIGSIISLLDLDDLVETYINDDKINTPLMDFDSEEILESGEFKFYRNYNDEMINTIEFDVISDFKDENTLIKITSIRLWV